METRYDVTCRALADIFDIVKRNIRDTYEPGVSDDLMPSVDEIENAMMDWVKNGHAVAGRAVVNAVFGGLLDFTAKPRQFKLTTLGADYLIHLFMRRHVCIDHAKAARMVCAAVKRTGGLSESGVALPHELASVHGHTDAESTQAQREGSR